MTMKKRHVIVLFSLFLFAFGLNTAVAADYPTKPVQFLIPFGAGGAADLMGRALASGAKPFLGQPIVAVNRPGAGGGIMYSALKAARPDGYTVGWNSTSILTSTNIGNVPFKYTAFDNICKIGYTGMPIAVRADAPWKTFKEFIAYAKENPGKIKIGNAGTGSGTHLVAVLIEKECGVQVVHVPLGGGRRIPSLLGGEMEAICVPIPEVAPQVQAGKARIIAMTTSERDPAFPDIPTLKEMGYNVAMDLFRGISVPKGTPENVIQKLEDAFKKGSESDVFKSIAKKNGFEISFMGRSAFEEYLKGQDADVAEAMKLGGLVK